jgi:uridylate kinase
LLGWACRMRSDMKYNRILLKLSGEALLNRQNRLCIDPGVTAGVAKRIKALVDDGVQVSIVVGGGNIFRGVSGEERGIDRSIGDYMGMLATIINALALQNAFAAEDVDCRVLTSISMPKVAEPFILRNALDHMAKGRVLIFGGGTGNPYFSTDTAAALRASELEVDVLLKGTKVDGIYSDDPEKNADATRFKTLTYTEALSRQLKVMDGAAFSLCMENDIPIIVFDFFEEGSIEGVMEGDDVGTLVTG